MQICKEHWSRIIEVLKEKDIYKFVSKDGKELSTRLKDKKEGKFFPDPLLGTNLSIIQTALETMGKEAMFARSKKGNTCILCICEDSEKGLGENWIQGSIQDQYSILKSKGFLDIN